MAATPGLLDHELDGEATARLFGQLVDLLGAPYFVGDRGLAMSSGVPIRRMIFERMPPTIELAIVSLIVSTGIGVLSGVASVTIRNRAIDYCVRTASILGQSLPLFWVGIMLIILFSVNLRWTPTSGRIYAGVAVITKRVFSYPGMGAWLLNGILERDYSVLQGGIIFVALAYVLMNMLVDILYHVIDPRLRDASD